MNAIDDGHTERHADGPLGSEISTALVRLLHRWTGRGPTKAKTYINRDVITVVLQDTLTTGERNLVDAGGREDVLHTRRLFQESMREDLVTTVERLSDRRVLAFLSANHVAPDIAVETFIMEAGPDADHDA